MSAQGQNWKDFFVFFDELHGLGYSGRVRKLSKAVPFMNMSMSTYSVFCGSAAFPWPLDKRTLDLDIIEEA